MLTRPRTRLSIDGTNSGKPNDQSFSDIEFLYGGADDDTFVLADGVTLTGSIAGGLGEDTLDHAANTTGVTIDLSAGTATGTVGIADIENIVTGASNDTIIGALGATLLDTGVGTDTLDLSRRVLG